MGVQILYYHRLFVQKLVALCGHAAAHLIPLKLYGYMRQHAGRLRVVPLAAEKQRNEGTLEHGGCANFLPFVQNFPNGLHFYVKKGMDQLELTLVLIAQR